MTNLRWKIVTVLAVTVIFAAVGVYPIAAARYGITQPKWLTDKIIKLGLDTRQVIARFEAERQALAMMDYPNIARVLDGGTTDSGVDCSGIVQRAAWRAGGAWLPRHSRALLRAGARVAPSRADSR